VAGNAPLFGLYFWTHGFCRQEYLAHPNVSSPWEMAMQINRPTQLVFPASAGTSAAAPRQQPASPPPVSTEPALPRESGVIYTGSADLDSMSLENQLEFGRNHGVFTKISLHKDGVLVATPPRASDTSGGFVASAVTTMKDFEEGLALLKQHSPDSGSKTMGFLSDKLRGLQNAASKLNVFA
jgi:hypothetical protein